MRIVAYWMVARAALFGKDSQLKRPAQPFDFAPVYVFLASGEASYISDEILGVTGGKPLA